MTRHRLSLAEGTMSQIQGFVSGAGNVRCPSLQGLNEIGVSPHATWNQTNLKGTTMTKEKQSKRGNKEAKKPKQEKLKVSATANSLTGKPALLIGDKKGK
ncbi:MAG: hypothetical protein ACJAZ1_002792 [Yoonia sp.]